jgi:hypothetical protein
MKNKMEKNMGKEKKHKEKTEAGEFRKPRNRRTCFPCKNSKSNLIFNGFVNNVRNPFKLKLK